MQTSALGDHVERFNAGVRTGDFGPMLERLAPDAELVFEGVPVGPFHGRDRIGQAYREQPPDDEIEVLESAERPDGVVAARYGWRRDHGRPAGWLYLTPTSNGITRIVVTFDDGAPVQPLDVAAIRADFPIFERDFDGKRLAYLDSASTSLKPRAVLEAIDGYNARISANVHRGIYRTGEEATQAYEGARAKVARFIGAPDAHEVVFVRNATEAINLLAYSWGRQNVGRGDTIVLTELEHHANLVPWQQLAQEREAHLEFVPFDEQGRLRLDVLDELLAHGPRLLAFTHVSNGLGTITPVQEIVERGHAAGATVFVDGAQAVPHVPVDVAAIGADAYVFSGHKTLGPTGSGVLWARRDLLESIPPFLTGGEMIREVRLLASTFNDIPWKFEAGTPDIAAAIGLGAAVEYLGGIGMDRVRAHERELVAYALEALPRGVPGIKIYGPRDPDERGGVVTFNLPGIHPHDVATLLDRDAVAVRAGHHCTQPLHEALGEAATARASFNVYSDRDDIDRLVAGLERVRAVFQRVDGSSR